VSFIGEDREFTLGWEAEGQALWLGRLRGEDWEAVEDFHVELRRGAEALWGPAASEAGRVAIPLAVLAQALEAGADQLVIQVEGAGV
jgi:hypothetical protein